MKKNHNAPACKRCHATGAGVQFPMFPRTKGVAFGELCVPCDEEMYAFNEYGQRLCADRHPV